MRIVAVLDLLGGEVVRGVAGRRQDYRPVVSRLTPSSRPLDVARAFHASLGLTELYLADLDALAGAPPALPLYLALVAEGFTLWVDAGMRGLPAALAVAASGVQRVVVGLETVPGPTVLEEIVRDLGDRVVFSLDLRGGVPLGDVAGWSGADPWSIAVQAVTLGVRRLLVLDVARVGVGAGTGTEDLCARLTACSPDLEVSAGGGVRGLDDLRRLRACGVSAVLMASALHDGTFDRAALESLPRLTP